GQVQQVAEPAGHALEVPDVGDRGGQLDVAHPLAAHLGAGHLDAAALTDDALEADALVLAAVALPVPGGTEDLLAEEAVLLRLQGAVVDGLRLLDLAVRPLTDVVGRGQADAQLVEEIDVEHLIRPLLSKLAEVRPLRRCSARADPGRFPVLPRHGRRLRRCPAFRWTYRHSTAPPRSDRATASP